jgi:superoxide dismutase, Fe-Mn family
MLKWLRSASMIFVFLTVLIPAFANAQDQPRIAFTLPELPYAVNALEPVIDAETMQVHHGRHHKAFIDNLNARADALPALKALSLTQILERIAEFDDALRNNAGGHYNHSAFWTMLAPPGEGGAPDEVLLNAIERDFGSLDALRERFDASARGLFGSGWTWLIVRENGQLAIVNTPNQDNPLMRVAGREYGTPLLALDVWEHAYYLKHRNRRADYIVGWWHVANWREANRRYRDWRGQGQGARD